MNSFIILAAGKSQRMGFPKGLMKVSKDETLIEHQLKQIASYGISCAYLVVWHSRDEYRKACESILNSRVNLKIIDNPLSDFGPFSSIKAGLRAWLEENPDEKNVAILPVDCPVLNRESFELLVKNAAGKTQVTVPSFMKKGGHPVTISRNFAQKIIKIDLEREDARLDVQIAQLSNDEKKYVEVQDENVLKNFNTPLNLEG